MEILDPQKQKFIEAFLDPKSPSFGNYRQSALTAGYSEDYADNISVQMPKWLSDVLGKNNDKVRILRDEGHIYIVKCREYYKIGITKQPVVKRLISLQTASPFEITVVASKKIKDIRVNETNLHKLLRDFHVRGEWFKLPDRIVDAIKQDLSVCNYG